MIKLHNYKAFIFDMDGVVINNHTYHLKAWELFCNKYNFPFNPETFSHNFFGKSNSEIISILNKGEVSSISHDILGEEKEEIYRNLYTTSISPHTGLVDFLNKLKSHQKLIGLASSAPISNIDFVLNSLNLRRYFDTIIDVSMVKQSKPNPEIFLKAAFALGVPPKECIVFEDSHAGIKAAKSAEMDVIILSTTHKKEELNYDSLIIEDFKELLTLTE
jgi:beta-phosphoglucomutase family hydrolase